MLVDYDNPEMPYRCPICFSPVSPCIRDGHTNLRTCGCMTCNCPAPVFMQKFKESEYIPFVLWNNWVIQYRREHPDYHKDYLCKDCLKDKTKCEYYDENVIHCLNAEYSREEL